MADSVGTIIEPVAELISRARRRDDAELIYVNDNYGDIVLAGQVTEQCILYRALDAYVRHFDIRVAPDAVAHIDSELGTAA